MHHSDGPVCRERPIDKASRMCRTTERRIEYHVRPVARLRICESRTLANSIAPGSKDHTSRNIGGRLSQRRPKQLIAHPGRGRMHGNAKPRPIRVTLREKRSRIIGIQHIFESFRILPQIPRPIGRKFG